MLNKQATKQTGQDPHRQEESRTTGYPSLAVGGESAAGNDAMEVGMVEQILPPSMKNGEEYDFRTQMDGVGCDDTQRFSCCTEKDVIDDFFVVKGDGGDLVRNRENNMEI